MITSITAYLQYLLPKKLLSTLAGFLADSHHVQLKNFLIQQFINHYHVDMSEALIEDPTHYPTFNSFFIRQLKPELRPIAPDAKSIVCPVDGCISQYGNIHQDKLFQAKNMYFDLARLVGNDQEIAKTFSEGHFITFYLAPHNYHRVHMPYSGKLIRATYIPGQFFSVNKMTSHIIPNLYSRNERIILFFETSAGLMTVILVGALLVGSIQLSWMERPIKGDKIIDINHDHDLFINKGLEIGLFKMGSTVILLFEKEKIVWESTIRSDTPTRYGQIVAKNIC